MDKSWMHEPRSSKAFSDGLANLIKVAVEKSYVNGAIYCPCKNCFNRFSFDADTVHEHLVWDGFQEGYKRWVFHGETIFSSSDDHISHIESVPRNVQENLDGEYQMRGLLQDTFGVALEYNPPDTSTDACENWNSPNESHQVGDETQPIGGDFTTNNDRTRRVVGWQDRSHFSVGDLGAQFLHFSFTSVSDLTIICAFSMDPDPRSSTPRKVKFAPKGPPRRTPKPTTTKIDVLAQDDGNDDESQQSLARKVNEHLTRRRPKVEKKSSVQVAFSHGVASTAIRTFGKQRERTDDGSEKTDDGSDAAYSKASPIDEIQNLVTSVSTAGTEGVSENAVDLTNAVIVKKKREYEEPWDYLHSNYPVTLPLRRPYSGDPELLDIAEFEEAQEYDENSLSSASDLGLLDQDDTPRMLFFTFPSNLPLGKQSTSASKREADDNLKALEKSVTNQKGKVMAGSVPRGSGMSTGTKGKEIAGSCIDLVGGYPLKKDCSLEELPEGYMGKMLVYKSGAVKLKLGDILYDVSPGSDCAFPQRVMVINTTNRHCCELGEPNKRAVVSLDIDSLLDNGID